MIQPCYLIFTKQYFSNLTSFWCKMNNSLFVLVPTTPTNIKIHEYFSGVEISWSSSSVADGEVHYNLLGLLNGVRKIFCTNCGLRYMLNETRPRMSYSFWVVAYNIKGGFESLQSSVFYFETPHKSKSFITIFL